MISDDLSGLRDEGLYSQSSTNGRGQFAGVSFMLEGNYGSFTGKKIDVDQLLQLFYWSDSSSLAPQGMKMGNLSSSILD